jgi:hypothetical protein
MKGRNFSIANGTVSATGTIIDITMLLLWQRSLLLRLLKVMLYLLYIEQPFCCRYFCIPLY